MTHSIDQYVKSLRLKGEKVIKLLNDDLAKWVFNLEVQIEEINDTSSVGGMHSVLLD